MTAAVTSLTIVTQILKHGMSPAKEAIFNYTVTQHSFLLIFCKEINIDQSLKEFWHAAACQLMLKLSEAKIFH